MTERGFHPFAVLHFLRKTILLYLLPLLQVLFARNWAALRTALVQGAALLTVLAAVSAAVLHAGRWRVERPLAPSTAKASFSPPRGVWATASRRGIMRSAKNCAFCALKSRVRVHFCPAGYSTTRLAPASR